MKSLIKFIILMPICLFVCRWALGSWLFTGIIFIAICILCGLIITINTNAETTKQQIYTRKLQAATLENPLLRTGVDSLSGEGFEKYCVDLLRLAGYTNIETTPSTGDKGIDIVCEKNEVKYGFQCKRYSGSVGVKAVQEAFAGAGYYNCDVPVVITNSYFTDAAIQMAERIGVELWDRKIIDELIKKEIDKTPASEKYEGEEGKSKTTALKIVAVCLALAIAAFAAYVIINDTFDSDEDEIDYSDYYDPTMVDDTYEAEPVEGEDEEISVDEESEENTSDLSEKTPYLLMREADIEKTKLGKPDTVEKGFAFDEMDSSHKSKEYTWGNLEDHTYFHVTVRYERHLSHNVDDVETYPDDNGYVSEIYYYDSEAGAYVSKSEYDE